MVDYVCSECGCEDIQVQMWVNPNTNQILDWVGEGMDMECWCPKCEAITHWMDAEEYQKTNQKK